MLIVSRVLNSYFDFRLKSSSFRQKIYRKALKRELRNSKVGRLILRKLGMAMAQNTSLHDEFSSLVGENNYQRSFWESDMGYSWFQDTIGAQNKYFEFALQEIKTN